jgi:hypothetical protein
MEGINIAPFTAQAQYADADRLNQLGEQQTWGPLFNYQRLISGQGGGTTTSSQPLYPTPVNAGLGGALLGQQLWGGQQSQPNNWGMDTQTAASFPW